MHGVKVWDHISIPLLEVFEFWLNLDLAPYPSISLAFSFLYN